MNEKLPTAEERAQNRPVAAAIDPQAKRLLGVIHSLPERRQRRLAHVTLLRWSPRLHARMVKPSFVIVSGTLKFH